MVNGVTKIFARSIPKFNIQAQCTSSIWHSLGGSLISWILAIHVHGKPPPATQLFLTLLTAGLGRGDNHSHPSENHDFSAMEHPVYSRPVSELEFDRCGPVENRPNKV